jgi:hypothetical protein
LLPLQYKVSASSHFNSSSTAHFSDNIEWSIDVESEIFVLTFVLDFNFLLSVDDIPLLVSGMDLVTDNNVASF